MTRPMDEARKAAREDAFAKIMGAIDMPDSNAAEYDKWLFTAAIDAYEAALKGAGWVIVPREASEAMLRAAIQAEADHYKPSPGSTYRARSIMEIHKLWSAMLDASEHPPASRKE